MFKYKKVISGVMFCALIASPLTVGLTHNSPKINAVYAASSGEVGYTFYTDQNFTNPSEQDSPNSYCFYVKNNNPYEVLICKVPYLDVSELVIPSTVSDGNYTYTITETRDNLDIRCTDSATKLTFSEGMRVITPFTLVWGLTNLKNIIFPSTLQEIKDQAFSGAMFIESLTFKGTQPPTISSMSFDSYFDSAKIYVPASAVTTYKNDSNWSKYVNNIEAIPEPGPKVGDTFTVEGIEYKVTAIGDTNTVLVDRNWSFAETKVNIPASVSYKDVSFEVTEIGEMAFVGISSITEVEIPASITNISMYAFGGCTNLVTFKSLASNPPAAAVFLNSCDNLENIFVPAASVDAYRIAAGWSTYNDKIVALPLVVGDKFAVDGLNYEITALGDTNTVKVGDNTSFKGTSVTIPSTVTYSDVTYDVTEIGERAFYKTGITKIEIPESVEVVGDRAFDYCKQLTTVTFAENSVLTIIDNFAFAETAIAEIKIPASVITIKDGVFDTCEALSKVTFEDNSKLTTIGAWSFEYTSITEFDFPTSVVTIDQCAFEGCQLTEINLPASVQTIDDCVFYLCSDLATVNFAENSVLTTIGAWAFSEIALAKIEIPASVTSIGEGAFEDCDNLATVKILATDVPTAGDGIFDWCDNLTKILVPEGSVEAYQTSWTAYADKIEGFHIHSIVETHSAVEPTCLAAGHKVYYECSCGKYFSDEALTQEITNLDAWLAEDGDGYIAPLGHDFGGEVTYTWNDDTHECTASWKCQHEGCTETQTETVVGVYVKDTDATTESNEKGHYEATFTIAGFEKQSTAPNSVEIPDTKLPSKGLSGGAIAGITVGAVAGAALISYAVMFAVYAKTGKGLKFLSKSFNWLKKLFKMK